MKIMTEFFEIKQVLKDISEVSGYMWNKGWAEKNAGNISVNITQILKNDISGLLGFS